MKNTRSRQVLADLDRIYADSTVPAAQVLMRLQACELFLLDVRDDECVAASEGLTPEEIASALSSVSQAVNVLENMFRRVRKS